MKFALEKPAFRILVNTAASVGAVGYTTALDPSMTLGPGTWGGSIISENVTAKHLMNIKSLAFETNPINRGDTVTSFKIPTSVSGTKTSGLMKEIEERLRARAGNLPLKDSFKKTKPEQPEKVQTTPEEKVYGTGISENEIKKIIEEFNFKK
jgi:acetaldehyde dehydrogenase (acetylating)